jgi:single-stranded DNA-binding protein
MILSGVGREDLNRGTNAWNGSGNLSSSVSYGNTRGGDDACNFKLSIDHLYKPTLNVRVNVYGGNVDVCRRLGLKKGDFVVVDGELMNRSGHDEVLTEVRCREIIVRPCENENSRRRERNGNRR